MPATMGCITPGLGSVHGLATQSGLALPVRQPSAAVNFTPVQNIALSTSSSDHPHVLYHINATIVLTMRRGRIHLDLSSLMLASIREEIHCTRTQRLDRMQLNKVCSEHVPRTSQTRSDSGTFHFPQHTPRQSRSRQ